MKTCKAYKIFYPQNENIMVSRDVKFMEDKQWSWEKVSQEARIKSFTDFDDVLVEGTRSLSKIYERRNIVIFETNEFKETEKYMKWIEEIKEKLRMIEKNDTW